MAELSCSRETGAVAPRAEPDRTPLDEALVRIGDRWSLLLVGSLLTGPRRFNELLDALPGLAPNVLSKRLRHLEHEGVIVATLYSERPPRFDYRLTASGEELAGVLRLLEQWGATTVPATVPLHHATCGTPVEAHWYCPTCARLVDAAETDDLRYV